MPSYLVTGASRGIGNPANTVIGLVRNVADTKAKIAPWKKSNIHIIEGDLNNYDSLKKAVEATSAITSGSLDYIIANAAQVPISRAFDPFSMLGQDPSLLSKDLIEMFNTNVVGNIHLFNLFMPLILKGTVKKVVTITSGMADLDLVVKYGVYESGPYSISKAAMNMAIAKFQAEYEKDGVLFIGISPGVVNTGQTEELAKEELPKLIAQVEKFKAYAPDFAGPATPEESVRDVLKVVESKSLENGDGGAFISHLGNKQWL